MGKRRSLLIYYLGVFLLIYLGAISTIFSPMPCVGVESGEKLATFSLEVDQQPLGEVLQQISKATGYEIAVDSELAQLPVTASLKNVTVHEALRRIFGKFSKYMIIDDVEKKISINMVETDGLLHPNHLEGRHEFQYHFQNLLAIISWDVLNQKRSLLQRFYLFDLLDR